MKLINVLSPDNVDDRQPVPSLVGNLFGKLVADRGYLFKKLGKQLIKTALGSPVEYQPLLPRRGNTKNQLISIADKRLLHKRALVEAIIDQRKNIAQIDHTRHRSPVNFMVNLTGGLIAYCR